MARRPLLTMVRPRHRRRRRYRTRLLIGMLLVGLLPLSLLAAIVLADLGSASQTTLDEANSTILQVQESDQQQRVADRARIVQASITGLVAQLQNLRQRVGDAARGQGLGAAPVTAEFATYQGLRYRHEPANGTVSAVIVAPPAAGGASLDTATGRAAVARSEAVTATAEPAMEAVLAVVGVRSVWIADTATGFVRVAPDLDVVAAVGSGGSGAIDPLHLLRRGLDAPFSALVRRSGDAVAEPQSWEGDSISPGQLSVRPSFSATYRATGPQQIGMTVWVPVSADSPQVVGIDVDVRQIAGQVGDNPASNRQGSSSLLVAGGRELLGASPLAIHALGLDDSNAVGSALALGPGAMRSGLDQVLGSGIAQTIRARIGGVDQELFTAPIRNAHWVLVSAVPLAELLPDQAALSRGIDSGVRHLVLVEVLPLVLGAVLLAVLLASISARRASGPLRALTEAAERLGDGNMVAPVAPQGHDEFGLLATSLERMRREVNAGRDAILTAAHALEGRVEERTAELRERNEELVALNRLAGSLTRTLDAETILRGGLESLAALLPLREGRGYVVEDGSLRALVGAGRADDGLASVARSAIDARELSSREVRGSLLVGLPLLTHDGIVGAFALRVAPRWRPAGRTRSLLRAVADQVGLALRTAQLSEEGRELAVLEERTRLAREIHDTLAQQLTAIVLQLEAAEAMVARDEGRTRSLVVSARDQARHALQEARRSVWDLRPASLEATGLAGAVATEAARLAQRTGVTVRVESDGLPRSLTVTPQDEVAVFRILQEALSNAGRHSRARHVDVHLAASAAELTVRVVDDGEGFDSGHAAGQEGGSFGLVGMEERARLIGAHLEVRSSPGEGTTVELRLPLGAPLVGSAS